MTPRRRIRILSPAEVDVADCMLQLADRSVSVALRFREAVESTLQDVAQFPASGATSSFLAERLQDCRLWPVRGFEKWLILYRDGAEAVDILRVVHSAQDLSALEE